MKTLWLFAAILLLSQINFAQTKIDEYEFTNSDTESAHIDNFLVALQNEPTSKGLIIIYSGANKQEMGVILRHIEGIKEYVNLRSGKSFGERIVYKVDERNKSFAKELWIYPNDIPFPEIKPINFDLDGLKTKYLYAMICLDCEPAVPLLAMDYANLKLYAELLKKYPDYQSSIIIYPTSLDNASKKKYRQMALNYAAQYRSLLINEYKISRKRISVVVAKNPNENRVISAKFYIVPKTTK